MKTYALFIILYVIVIFAATAKIKNGYSIDIQGARESLKSLHLLLKDNNLSYQQKTSMKNSVTALIKFIKYYELTEKLLSQFRLITPDLYNEIGSLKDASGRRVDIYVKFVPETDMPKGVAGTTNIGQEKNDENAYSSEYGTSTVSIKIAAVNKALFLLAHELGHVKYQVPNLASYIQFHSKFYLLSAEIQLHLHFQ